MSRQKIIIILILIIILIILIILMLIILRRGGALVESMTFNQMVVGSTPALAATLGPWASPLPTVACVLRLETSIQYPCCSRERL